MDNQKKEALLREVAEEILHKMTFENFEILIGSESAPDGESIIINIQTPDSSLLIGQHGVTLAALQHILRLIVRSRTDEKFKFLLDINRYLQSRTDSIADTAKEAATQATNEKKPVVLRPMSAYERRLVHLALAEDENVQTESIGENEDRKVVIRPVGELEKLEVTSKI
jgi:spoIIIJ-associated protein